jgi:hypothetical protein
VEPPRVPSPELIHLLDSDTEEEEEVGDEHNEEMGDFEDSTTTEGFSDARWQGILEERIRIPQAPRLLIKNLGKEDSPDPEESPAAGSGEKRKLKIPQLDIIKKKKNLTRARLKRKLCQ